MRRIKSVLLACALAGSALSMLPADAARPPAVYGYIPMSDGVTLKFQALLPDPDRWGPGPYPMVMDYSGYIPAEVIYDGLRDRFRESGYAVIGLNIRGTHCSGGYFDYFEPRQALDGKEAVEWLTGNRITPGYERPAQLGDKLAMVGKSYPGITQLFVAAQQPKGLAGIVPGHVFGDLYRDVPFPGGILNAAFAGAWSGQRAAETMYSGWRWYSANQGDTECRDNQVDHIPNTPYNPFVQATYNQYDGPLFWQRSPWWWADKIDVPTMLVESWQDEQVGSRATHLIDRFRPGLKWKFVSANGDHGEYYGDEMLPHIYRFLEYTLRGETIVPADFWNAYPRNGYGSEPRAYEATQRNLGFTTATAQEYWAENPVIINFENLGTGESRSDRNSRFTKTFSSWPPPNQTVDRLYLSADGTMTEQEPAWVEPDARNEAVNARVAGAVDYAYMPYAGTQERGGITPNSNVPPPGNWQRRPPAGSYAAFSTAPLQADKVMMGAASADLYISSTQPDTDLEVTLTEVRADGQEMFVQKGWLRASHRIEDGRFSTPLRPFQTHRLGDLASLVPGHPSLGRVEIFPFAHAFRAGSKIRIWVTAPNVLPDYWGFASLPTPAVNTIFTSGMYPSSLALPLLAGETIPASAAGYAPCGKVRNQPCRPEA